MVASTKLYDLLGVKPDASENEIKKAYHKRALACHPDKEQDSEKRPVKEQEFKDLSEAYAILSDSKKRQIYDQTGVTDSNDGPRMNAHDFFTNLFGGGMSGSGSPFSSFFEMSGSGIFSGQGRAQQVRPVVKMVSVTLKQLYCQESQVVEVDVDGKCESCQGCGAKAKELVKTCEKCNGQGHFMIRKQMGPIMTQQSGICSKCQGVGETVALGDHCSNCQGKKVVSKTRRFKMTFDSSTSDGQKIVYNGKGNWYPKNDDSYGDLVFHVRITPDSRFQRKGNDLETTVKISLAEALLAKELTFEHLDGEQYSLNWSKEKTLNPNKTYKVRGAGLGEGSLIIRILVDYPTYLTPQQREVLQSVLGYEEPTEAKNKRVMQMD